MRVLPFNFPLDDRLIQKIDLMLARCTQRNPKKDAVLLFEGAEGEGKCLKKGSKVLMANGSWKNVEEIKEGDLILSPQLDGSNIFAKVNGLSNWFCNEPYNVMQFNKTKNLLYTCSNNHPIPINVKVSSREKLTEKEKLLSRNERFDIFKNKKRNKGEWIVRNYEASYYSNLSKDFKKNSTSLSSFEIKNFKDRIDCKIEPYSLGVYLGDGSFSSLKKGRSINITNSNFKILQEISKYYPIMSSFKTEGRNTTNYHFSINGEFSKFLIEYGLEGKGSGEKFIPPDALLSDSNYRKKLLAGLIDTDGWYYQGGYNFTLKSKKLIEGIRDLIYSLGGRTGNIRKVKKRIKSTGFEGTYYSISLYLKDLELPLINKHKIKKEHSFYLSSNRISIDVVKSKPCQVYGFSLDSPSKLFITDNWMITHNTTYSVAVGYYAAWKTGREFDHTKVFFDLKEMIEFLQSTEDQIAIWDEPALQALSKDALSTIVKDLERLLMMARKKRHFIMINLAYFNKFSEYIVWQRPLGMIHVYSRREIEPGRFVYIKKKALERLWYDWRTKKKRNYRKYASKGIRGTFPNVMDTSYKNNVLSHFDINYYEKKKDEAIMKIGKTTEKVSKKLLLMRYLLMKYYKGPIDVLAEEVGVSSRTIYNWKEIPYEPPIGKNV